MPMRLDHNKDFRRLPLDKYVAVFIRLLGLMINSDRSHLLRIMQTSHLKSPPVRAVESMERTDDPLSRNHEDQGNILFVCHKPDGLGLNVDALETAALGVLRFLHMILATSRR